MRKLVFVALLALIGAVLAACGAESQGATTAQSTRAIVQPTSVASTIVPATQNVAQPTFYFFTAEG